METEPRAIRATGRGREPGARITYCKRPIATKGRQEVPAESRGNIIARLITSCKRPRETSGNDKKYQRQSHRWRNFLQNGQEKPSEDAQKTSRSNKQAEDIWRSQSAREGPKGVNSTTDNVNQNRGSQECTRRPQDK